MTASLALIAAAAFGTPTVTVVDPLHVRMSNREPLTFVAYLTEAKPADVSVTVPELKDPDTKPINPSGSLKVEPVADENGNARITLTPIGNEWNRFGDFAATVRIAVKDVATPLIKAATFSRVKPDLAVIDLAGKNFDMTRPYPWCSASRDVMVHLHNRSGAQVDRVTFAGHAIGEGGYVTVFPALKTVQPGVTPLRLWIHDITKAGTIPVKMSFTVPGAQTADEVSFNLLVSDNWPVPLLAIAAGVFLAFLVNLLANRLRPIQENRYRGLRLRQQVANLRLSSARADDKHASIGAQAW
ncbi:MAG TPA: hypothetical protein VGQ46_20320 [Thermoanaerobaculia bacterium]|nr:hypothetical protein [Thermoanaerobaculia bacterium]